MRSVTVDTVILEPWAATSVPVPVHAPVASMRVVSVLGTVALGAELDGVREFDQGGICEVQHRAVRIVATVAAKLPVDDLYTCVECLALTRSPCRRGVRAVTGHASHADRLAIGVEQRCVGDTQRVGLVHGGWIPADVVNRGTERARAVREAGVTSDEGEEEQ